LTVTVRVLNDLGPEQGATIVFQDASGAVLMTATTDATGTTSQVVAGGGQVTAVFGTSSSIQLVTVEGVQPGDVLTAYDPTSSPFANSQVSIDSLPDDPPPPGTASFSANVGQCSAGFVSPPIQVAIEQSCQNRGTFPLLVQAVGGQDAGYATLGYLYSNGNTLPADGGVAHVSPTGTWSTGNGSQDIVVTNAPTSVGNGATTFSQIANGVPDYFSDYATGDGTYTFAWQPGYPTSLQSESVV
jgi:hypothetical protein